MCILPTVPVSIICTHVIIEFVSQLAHISSDEIKITKITARWRSSVGVKLRMMRQSNKHYTLCPDP